MFPAGEPVALIDPSVCKLQDDADLAAVKRAMAKIMAKITKETHKTPRSTFVVNGIVVSENGVRVVFTADTWNRVLATRAMVHELAPLVGAYGDDLGEPAPQGRAIQVPVAMPNVSIPPTEAAKLVEGLSSLLPGKCGPFSFSPDEMDLVMYEFGPDLGLRTRTAPLAHAPFKAQSIEPLAR